MRTGLALPRLAPFGLYRCADGWVALFAPQEKLAVSPFKAMGPQTCWTIPDSLPGMRGFTTTRR